MQTTNNVLGKTEGEKNNFKSLPTHLAMAYRWAVPDFLCTFSMKTSWNCYFSETYCSGKSESIFLDMHGHSFLGPRNKTKQSKTISFEVKAVSALIFPKKKNTFFHWTIKQTGTRHHHRAFSVQLSGTDLAGRWVRSVAWISLDKTDVSLVYSKMCLGGSIHFEQLCLFLCFKISGLRYQFVLFALEVVWFLTFPMFSDLFTFRPLTGFWSVFGLYAFRTFDLLIG